MAEEGLRIKIGADVTELQTSLDKADKDLKAFGFTIDKIGGKKFPSLFDLTTTKNTRKVVDEIEKIKPGVDVVIPSVVTLKRELEAVGRVRADKPIKDIGVALQSTAGGSNRAAFALQNLGRIAQDAPFGFIGIQNNIEPLVQSFQSLKRESGSTGAALKALAGGLSGAGGVLLGFSLVTSAITVAVQKYGSLGKALQALTSSGKDWFKAQQETLAIQKEATEASGRDVAKLKFLSAIISDNTQATEARKGALGKLREEYGPYLKNVTDEAFLNGKAASEIERTTQALLNKALALASENKLAEVAGKQLDAQLKLVDVLTKLGSAEDELRKARERSINEGPKGIAAVDTRVSALENQVDSFKGQAEDLIGVSGDLRKGFDRILEASTNFSRAAGNIFKGKPIKVPKVEIPKTDKITAKVDTLSLEVATVEFSKGQPALEAALEKLRKETIANTNPTEGIPLNLTIPQAAFDALRKFGEDANWKLIQEKSQSIITQFDKFLTPVINTAFEALGNGANIFKAIGQSLKALVVQIGIAIARAAILAAILSSTGIGAVGAAGEKITGFGAIFKNLLGIRGAAGPNIGGITGGGLALSGGVRIEARGTDLVGVLSGSNARIGRVG
jgi:hypothetical protein